MPYFSFALSCVCVRVDYGPNIDDIALCQLGWETKVYCFFLKALFSCNRGLSHCNWSNQEPLTVQRTTSNRPTGLVNVSRPKIFTWAILYLCDLIVYIERESTACIANSYVFCLPGLSWYPCCADAITYLLRESLSLAVGMCCGSIVVKILQC